MKVHSPTMLMEGWGMCLIPQNTFRVSGVNSVATKSNDKHKMTDDNTDTMYSMSQYPTITKPSRENITLCYF